MPTAAWTRSRMRALTDEELGKKSDDISPATPSSAVSRGSGSRSWRMAPTPRTTKRWVFLLAFAVTLWLGLSFLYPYATADGPTWPSEAGDPPPRPRSASSSPPPMPMPIPRSRRGYDGPLRFVRLGETLRSPERYGKMGTPSAVAAAKPVLFAAASLRSAATLLPIACQMADQSRNFVNFAMMGSSEIEYADLLALNGIDPDRCEVLFHDGRPDMAAESSPARLSRAAARALFHIHSYRRPHVVITDSGPAEEEHFVRSIRRQSADLSLPFLELPDEPDRCLSWMVKLDGSSLAALPSISIDILIRAPAHGSGGLIRLLQSLSRADFGPIPIPRLTIELPARLELPAERFVQAFSWPPRSAVPDRANGPMLAIRRRIGRRRMTETESSVRFLESFWPSGVDPARSHVLVLSPQVELSPLFFHYLRLVLLEHRYSSYGPQSGIGERLMAISLHLPTAWLNGTQPLSAPAPPVPPTAAGADVPDVPDVPQSGSAPFLWQAPDSSAILFMGDKWKELHGFVSQLQDPDRSRAPPALLEQRATSGSHHPAWVEHALQLSRARGYVTLYPAADVARAMVTLHTDLPYGPEEYGDGRDGGGRGNPIPPPPPAPVRDDDPDDGSRLGVLGLALRAGERLTPLSQLPVMTWDGRAVDLGDLAASARGYTRELRIQAGCSAGGVAHVGADPYALDLFCSPAER